MRNLYSAMLVTLFFVMLLVPLAADIEQPLPQRAEENGQSIKEESFKIKRGEEIITLSETEYIVGVVAAEMPALYEPEALKAQAVAAYTYAVRKRASAGEEYHLTDQSALDQSFQDETERKEKWGEKYEEYEQKIRAAVNSVCGQLILYEGEPIFAAYHAVSSGHTEAAVNVWGKEVPYLCGVLSVADKLCETYKSEITLTPADLSEKLSCEKLPENAAEWVIKRECSEVGTVIKFSLGENEYNGSEVREKLGLRSSCFETEYRDGNFVFTVYGYGHGVGMSQYGANQMAKSGADYKEILLWYYKGCEIK